MDKHPVVQGLAMRKIRLTFLGWLMQGDADGPIAARLRRRRPVSDGVTGRPVERYEQRKNWQRRHGQPWKSGGRGRWETRGEAAPMARDSTSSVSFQCPRVEKAGRVLADGMLEATLKVC